jgi:hypothetical protein
MKTLQMVFNNAAGRTVTLSLADVRDTLTDAEVRTVMDFIIARDIFTSTGGQLVSVRSASVVDEAVTDLIKSQY